MKLKPTKTQVRIQALDSGSYEDQTRQGVKAKCKRKETMEQSRTTRASYNE